MAEHPPAAAVDAEALSEDAAPPALQPLGQALAGEVLGTYLLVLFGAGSVAAAVLTGAQQGLWQVAVVWGFGVTLAIYASAALSGAHLNPAVSLAFALCRDFPARRLAPYIAARDFGPRLVTYALGWGDIAIPGPRGGFWAYIVEPMIGAPLGGLVWQLTGQRLLAPPN